MRLEGRGIGGWGEVGGRQTYTNTVRVHTYVYLLIDISSV